MAEAEAAGGLSGAAEAGEALEGTRKHAGEELRRTGVRGGTYKYGCVRRQIWCVRWQKCCVRCVHVECACTREESRRAGCKE